MGACGGDDPGVSKWRYLSQRPVEDMSQNTPNIQTVNIDTTDIVTVQQASENENATSEPFVLGRNHYSSTEVVIDGVEVAPKTFFFLILEVTHVKINI